MSGTTIVVLTLLFSNSMATLSLEKGRFADRAVVDGVARCEEAGRKAVAGTISVPNCIIITPSPIIVACEDQVSWCNRDGIVIKPSSVKQAMQCERYAGTCKNGKPIELADSGCVDPDAWENFCTDEGKVRPPTAEELHNLERCGEWRRAPRARTEWPTPGP